MNQADANSLAAISGAVNKTDRKLSAEDFQSGKGVAFLGFLILSAPRLWVWSAGSINGGEEEASTVHTGLADLSQTVYGMQPVSLIRLYGFAKYIP